MNQENQNIEWKESWRDEYLKWICGFANAQGGKIYIGKTDKGEIIDLKDAPKLLEDIPNKVRDILGILVNVNLLTEKDRQYLEIEIESYPAPISYKGQYHYRTNFYCKKSENGGIASRFRV
jgi:ATP-dependent DNA helicase RecG